MYRQIIEQAASDLAAAGAEAVVLTGSHARGNAGELSDIDLHAIGIGPAYRLEERDGRIISMSWHTVAEVEASFLSPASAGAAVPGWRTAEILHDPHDVAAALVQRARIWTWGDIGGHALDDWVAEEITGLAEEVFKLVQLMTSDRRSAAAVQRNVLALRVPIIMATHLRLLYDSENVLWDQVGEALGAPWSTTQARALGIHDESFAESCTAALRLYALASELVSSVLNERQKRVVDSAARVLERHIRRT